MRVVLNLVSLAVEIALIAGAAWLAATQPLVFAAVAAGAALLQGLALEYARFSHEMPFYFGRTLTGLRAAAARVWTTGEAVIKAGAAGFVALLMVSGTNAERLWWTAILFGVVTFLGTTVLLRISLNWRHRALRWGYFRLALPLGILFSAGIFGMTEANLLPQASFSGLAYTATFELAQSPTIQDASEFLFQLSQATDSLIAKMLGFVIPEAYVPFVQIVASTNVLPGFVIAVFAVAIAQVALIFGGHGLQAEPVVPTETTVTGETVGQA